MKVGVECKEITGNILSGLDSIRSVEQDPDQDLTVKLVHPRQ